MSSEETYNPFYWIYSQSTRTNIHISFGTLFNIDKLIMDRKNNPVKFIDDNTFFRQTKNKNFITKLLNNKTTKTVTFAYGLRFI